MSSAYTPSQISEYLAHLSLPPSFHPASTPPPTLDITYLTTLHVHQISTIPYENLSLHYSPTRTNNLSPQSLFTKFVHSRRGGYCMETAIFYNHILRALGFTCYTAGVKIRLRREAVPYGAYVGWVHVVNIVTLADGSKWMCDVGFGGDGATKPLELADGKVVRNLGKQDVRLVQETIPEQVDKSRKYWVYQYRNGVEQEWNSYYAFPEWEFSEADLGIMNYWTSQSPESFQVKTVLMVKFLREDSEIVGKVMMWNELVKRFPDGRGKTEVVLVCSSEAQRVKAIKDWFGVELSKDQVEGIKGHVSEIKD